MAEKKKNTTRNINPTQKRHTGRPTVMTKEVIDKLEFGFAQGLNDDEACLYAGINPDTLYEYQKKHPNFTERKKLLKNTLPMVAKMKLAQTIDHNALDLEGKEYAKTLQWYLERKRKDEFSVKQEQEVTTTAVQKVYITKEDEQNVTEHIDDMIND